MIRFVISVILALGTWYGICASYGAWSWTWDDQKLASLFLFPVAMLSMAAAFGVYRIINTYKIFTKEKL